MENHNSAIDYLSRGEFKEAFLCFCGSMAGYFVMTPLLDIEKAFVLALQGILAVMGIWKLYKGFSNNKEEDNEKASK